MATQTKLTSSSLEMKPTKGTTGEIWPYRIYHTAAEGLCTAFLITESNIKAYVLPVTLFTMLSITSGRVTANPDVSWGDIAACFPRALLYIWLYVFYFDCSNQKDAESAEEDRLDKPWRPIPSGRMAIAQMQTWYKFSILLLLATTSTHLGGLPEALAFMAETWIYDHAHGASTWWGKNLINALFYGTGMLGGLRVAAGSTVSSDNAMAAEGARWCVFIGLMIFSTVQVQDLRDQVGDAARGRRTLPLVLGDGWTRLVTGLLIVFWSGAACVYWGGGLFTYGLVMAFGGLVGLRVLACRSVGGDRKTFHCYTLLWLPAIYAVPLVSRYDVALFR